MAKQRSLPGDHKRFSSQTEDEHRIYRVPEEYEFEQATEQLDSSGRVISRKVKMITLSRAEIWGEES